MGSEPWLPIAFSPPGFPQFSRHLDGGEQWQIYSTADGGRALVADPVLAHKWLGAGILAEDWVKKFRFGAREFFGIWSGPGRALDALHRLDRPHSKAEALAFARSMLETRRADSDAVLDGAIFVERFLRILPTTEVPSELDDDLLFGRWLTGGFAVRASDIRGLRSFLGHWPPAELKEVIEAAGIPVHYQVEEVTGESGVRVKVGGSPPAEVEGSPAFQAGEEFSLPGRPELETFFNEHVVEPVRHSDRYAAFGLAFPAPILLHGPPGTGKTFAVQALAAYLGWQVYQVDASTIGSPYIHETSRKIAEVFDMAREAAPCLLIIDEMDAFLSRRDAALGQHKVEEVAEFLRRLPEAPGHRVLVVGMTNRMEAIDDAVLRRGRFDHVIEVGPASLREIEQMLDAILRTLPLSTDVEPLEIAKRLDGRPLSDVAFVVREAARLAAREGLDVVEQSALVLATERLGTDIRSGETPNRIGF